MSAERLFHVGVKALIINDEGEYLVLEADTSIFEFPGEAHSDLAGGRIQVGQDPLEALRREVEEETGITEISDIEFFTAVISPMEIPVSATDKVGLLLMVYKVRIPADSKIVLSDEHTKYEWVDKREAAKRLEFKFGQEFTDRLLAA